ncbi:MAG TPA: filamentous hemagglutinin N-terminal domain-containing protein [Nitrospira sp.]|nr:filamentous hemagglutinin N-terminal domain-containing protein [Nitrospira sp.]
MGYSTVDAWVPWIFIPLVAVSLAALPPPSLVTIDKAYAQVTTSITPTTGAGNLGTTVTPAGTTYNITGGTRPGNGPNLFHSFGNFTVGSGDIANFVNNTGLATSNILSRVTGGNPSQIYGMIQTEGFGNANLFLMNPAGILFGPSATLNVGGAAHFTTADYIRLFDGANSANFYANPASDGLSNSVLSVSSIVDFGFLTPAAFGFLTDTPASITVQGSTLTLPLSTDPVTGNLKGSTLSLIGGNISIGADPDSGTPASISVPSGHINLVSVASPGEVLYPSLQSGPNINGQSFTARGTISISDFSLLDVSGIVGQGNEAGGAIRIRGGQFVMDNLSVIQNMTMGDAPGANPGVSIVVDHEVRLDNLSSISVGTNTGLGRSGNLEITAENVEVLNGSFLSSSSGGPASPGNITISANRSVTVAGLDPFVGTEVSNITTTAQSSTEGGHITISAPGATLSVQDNGVIGTSSDTGRAGNITITSDVLNVTNGGAVRTISSSGSSGSISIAATHSTFISGQSDLGNFSSIANSSQTSPANIFITTGQFVLGDKARIDGDTATRPGGTVQITATGSLNISGDSVIRSSTSLGSGTSLDLTAPSIVIDHSTLSTRISGSDASAVGGTIKARATDGTLTVANNSLVAASTTGAAAGGPIQLVASEAVIVTGNSRIESTSTGAGNAGSISINAGQQLDMHDSSIKTEAAMASGGNIDIRAVDRVSLVNSTISTSVLGGSGGGGNITIDPTLISLQNNSNILAQAVLGNGGNIQLIANLLLVDPSSVISASSEFGQSGTIQSPTSNLAGTVSSLPSSTRQGQALQAQRCAVLNAGGSSSFIIAGRDQVPTEPGGWMVSSLDALATAEGSVARDEGEGLAGSSSSSGLSSSSGSFGAVRPKSEINQTNQIDQIDQMDQPNLPPVLSLRRLTPAGFLTQRFAESEASGCRS